MTRPTVPGEAGRPPQAGRAAPARRSSPWRSRSVLWRSREVDLLAWVPAASRDAVITGYAQALAAAGGPGAGADPDTAAASFLGWLATTSQPWLVVLDDLADAADLDGLWPRGAAGMVLVTTRLPADAVSAPGRSILEIGPFSPREALSYLSARLTEDAGMRAGALDLAADLGYLPLGLAQAAAVIADTGDRLPQLPRAVRRPGPADAGERGRPGRGHGGRHLVAVAGPGRQPVTSRPGPGTPWCWWRCSAQRRPGSGADQPGGVRLHLRAPRHGHAGRARARSASCWTPCPGSAW